MLTCDELYRRFGPILLEAECRLLLDNINELRSAVSLPLLSKQDILDQLNNHLSDIQPYDWMLV